MRISGTIYKIDSNKMVIRTKAYIYIVVTFDRIKTNLAIGNLVRCYGSWYNKKYLKNDFTVDNVKTFQADEIKRI